jgi:hypothetical protein
MRWCQTDLAATAYRWRRFVGREGPDDMRFGELDEGGIGHDGVMAEEVVRRGWKARGRRRGRGVAAGGGGARARAARAGPRAGRACATETRLPARRAGPLTQVAYVRDRCLVEHAPSAPLCALRGGVWDDTRAATPDATGGRCLGPARAAEAAAKDGIEEVEVDLAHDASERWGGGVGDGRGEGEQGRGLSLPVARRSLGSRACAPRHYARSLVPPPGIGLPGGPLKLRCLRPSDPAAWGAMAAYFPPACAAPEDAAAPGAGEAGGGGGGDGSGAGGAPAAAGAAAPAA